MLLSAITLVLEVNTRLLEPVRAQISTLLLPLFLIAESPYRAGGELSDLVATREMLQAQVDAQSAEILALSRIAQQYESLRAENERLRALLGSRARVSSRVLVAELVGVVPAPDTRQVILDKGSTDGVLVDAPVIDAQGLFGRVVEVGRSSSRVLLVTDAAHAVPVQINRNGVRSIAGGTGDATALELENVPVTADVVEGDLVETSGLGGGFPAGFPVGIVQSVRIETTAPFALIEVLPLAELDRARHLLILLDVPAAPVAVDAPAAARSNEPGSPP